MASQDKLVVLIKRHLDLRIFLASVAALATVPLSISDAHSADIKVNNFGADQPSLIDIAGSIEAGDAEQFSAATQGIAQAIVFLSSPGGAVDDGLSLAAEIRSRGYTTIVSPEKECYSACALIWVAGVERVMGETASIGVHAAWREEAMADGTAVATESGVANADIGAFLSYVGLSREAIRYFTTAGPDEVLPLTPDIAQRLGIDTAVIRSDRLEPASERPSPYRLATETAQYIALGINCGDFYGLDENWLTKKSRNRLELGHELFGGDVFAELIPMALEREESDIARMGVRAWCEEVEHQLRSGGLPTGVTGPSFDCAMANTVTERGICTAPELWMPDRAMSSIFKLIQQKGSAESKRELIRRQRAWLNRRDTCGNDVLCLADRYDAWFLDLTSLTTGLP